MSQIDLPGDSGDYHLLADGVMLSAGTGGLTCEIGLRRGGGTKVIIDSLVKHSPHKTHIAIDPYGHIIYQNKEGSFVKLDYTNQMRDECLANLYKYVQMQRINFLFFNMKDDQFFELFKEGVPVFDGDEGSVRNNYSFVHFDGPHAVEPLIQEIQFFDERCLSGACWVFDDITEYYDHSIIDTYINDLGWVMRDHGHHKALYQKK